MPLTTRWLDIAEVKMLYSVDGERCMNVYHVRNGAGPWAIATLLDLGDTFVDWESMHAAAQRSDRVTLDQVTVTDLTSLTSPRVSAPVSPAIQGTHAGAAAANNVTLAIKHNTGVRGRGRQGRSFWIGLTDTMIVANHVVGSDITNITAVMENIITMVEALDPDYRMVVAHRQFGGLVLLDGTWSDVLSYDVSDAIIDSQRDRLPGHKRHKKHVIL